MGPGRRLAAFATLIAAAAALTPPGAGAADSDWSQRALADQYELGSAVELRNAPWVGTHNSYNSVAEMGPTLSNQDSNQRITIVDQLELGVRSLELDLHWFPSAAERGFAPVVCHATGEHAGCTIEKPLGPVLEGISAWLREHDDQVLLLYLEDHLDNQEGYDEGAATVVEKLGDRLYRPPSNGCTELPLELTRDEVRAAGKQVIVVSRCGVGAEWPSVAFSWAQRRETRPRGYTDFPDCGSDFDPVTYATRLIRYYEDSTRLTATVRDPDDGITPETAAAMSRCGVDLFGLDQLVSGDPRLEALVWSWAPGEPGGGRCALERASKTFPFGRWYATPCGQRHHAACRAQDGRWLVPPEQVRAHHAPKICSDQDAAHAVPRTGFEAQELRLAIKAAAAEDAWIAFRGQGGGWAAR